MPKATKRKRTTSTPLTFNHAMVYVRELAPAVRFYADLLGFQVIEQVQPFYARLRAGRGQTTIALHVLEPGQSMPDNGGVRLYFEVQPLERFCKKLEAAGIPFSQPPKMMPWGWKHAYLKDPDGHEVSLYWAGAKRFRKSPPMKQP